MDVNGRSSGIDLDLSQAFPIYNTLPAVLIMLKSLDSSLLL